ncbi:MAG: hypothetical protein HY658_00845 [Actinobacteria bacterium]|nr:hypothetical protein [Actinomycetota bacterium]
MENAFALGTFRTIPGADTSCPAGFDCQQYSVTCSGIPDARAGTLAAAPATGPPRGLVMFFSGGSGSKWWGDADAATIGFMNDLRADGFHLVVVRWHKSWLDAPSGQDIGPDRLACQPATTIRWVHDNLYAPLGVSAGPGRCGFCLTGSSGGASQVAYPLSHFGLDVIVDAIVPTGGPPHAALAKGCLRNPAEEEYWYDGASVKTIDASYGHYGPDGPCQTHQPTFANRWAATSVDTSGSDYRYEQTRVVVLLGSRDRVLPHARDYVQRLQQAGSPAATLQLVDNTGHEVGATPEGRAAIRQALLA